MSIGKARKGIIKNGVLVSVMAFYFSCGKDVFPPDFPDEPSSERGAATASLVLHEAEERFPPCTVYPASHPMYPLTFSSSAIRMAPPAAPRTVLCDSPTKR